MRITYEKINELKKSANNHRRALYRRFVEAHEVFNNQNQSAIKVIAEYNFWGGYHYAILKMEQIKRLSK